MSKPHLHGTHSVNSFEIAVEVGHLGITAVRCNRLNGRNNILEQQGGSGHPHIEQVLAQCSANLSVKQPEQSGFTNPEQATDLFRSHSKSAPILIDDPQEKADALVHRAPPLGPGDKQPASPSMDNRAARNTPRALRAAGRKKARGAYRYPEYGDTRGRRRVPRSKLRSMHLFDPTQKLEPMREKGNLKLDNRRKFNRNRPTECIGGIVLLSVSRVKTND